MVTWLHVCVGDTFLVQVIVRADGAKTGLSTFWPKLRWCYWGIENKTWDSIQTLKISSRANCSYKEVKEKLLPYITTQPIFHELQAIFPQPREKDADIVVVHLKKRSNKISMNMQTLKNRAAAENKGVFIFSR